jgi:hypothetical protein
MRDSPTRQGCIAGKIGKTHRREFEGGEVLADKRGKPGYLLRAYAPNVSDIHAQYDSALLEFRRRLREELLLPFG